MYCTCHRFKRVQAESRHRKIMLTIVIIRYKPIFRNTHFFIYGLIIVLKCLIILRVCSVLFLPSNKLFMNSPKRLTSERSLIKRFVEKMLWANFMHILLPLQKIYHFVKTSAYSPFAQSTNTSSLWIRHCLEAADHNV